MLKEVGDDDHMARYSQGYVENLTEGFAQDARSGRIAGKRAAKVAKTLAAHHSRHFCTK